MCALPRFVSKPNKLSVFLRLTMNTLKRDTNPPLKEYANVSRFSSSALKFRLDGVVSIFLNLFFNISHLLFLDVNEEFGGNKDIFRNTSILKKGPLFKSFINIYYMLDIALRINRFKSLDKTVILSSFLDDSEVTISTCTFLNPSRMFSADRPLNRTEITCVIVPTHSSCV